MTHQKISEDVINLCVRSHNCKLNSTMSPTFFDRSGTKLTFSMTRLLSFTPGETTPLIIVFVKRCIRWTVIGKHSISCRDRSNINRAACCTDKSPIEIVQNSFFSFICWMNCEKAESHKPSVTASKVWGVYKVLPLYFDGRCAFIDSYSLSWLIDKTEVQFLSRDTVSLPSLGSTSEIFSTSNCWRVEWFTIFKFEDEENWRSSA